MLPGRYVEVITGFSDPLELTGKVREGYLKIAWKTDSSIKIGYIILQKGHITGSILEDVFENVTLEGEIAFLEILDAIKRGSIKAVEVYEANLKEIFQAHPNSRIVSKENRDIPGYDLSSLLSLLKSYNGSVKVQNTSKAWAIHVEMGAVKAAKALKGSTSHGDRAVRELLQEMGHVIKNGKYSTGESFEFSSQDNVQDSDLFIESVELLREKQKVEKDF